MTLQWAMYQKFSIFQRILSHRRKLHDGLDLIQFENLLFFSNLGYSVTQFFFIRTHQHRFRLASFLTPSKYSAENTHTTLFPEYLLWQEKTTQLWSGVECGTATQCSALEARQSEEQPLKYLNFPGVNSVSVDSKLWGCMLPIVNFTLIIPVKILV